ncbi:MAG: hypothetical protein ACRDT2_03350 [Natronosporangium sp.]
MTTTAEITVRMLKALNIRRQETVRELLTLAVVHQLPTLAPADVAEVLAAFPPADREGTVR